MQEKNAILLSNNSIAVLPFVDLSEDQSNDFFCDGITEEIINALSKIMGLKVIARTSSFAFKNKNIDIREIGKQLDVASILEGSVRKANDKVRITAQLVNTEDGSHFWSKNFDRSFDDILALQDEISLLIADQLRENLGHFEIQDKLSTPLKINAKTYQQFLKGKYHIRKFNPIDIHKGIGILKELNHIAPEFPLAYLSIHLGYSFLGAIGIMPAHKAFAEGKYYLYKAIAIDETLPECQFHLANIAFWQHWDMQATQQHLAKALEIRPGYADVYNSLARSMVIEGKLAAAINYNQTALELDPFSAANQFWHGCILYLLEKYEMSIPFFQKSLSLDPNFLFSRTFWGAALLKMGKLEEGLQIYQESSALGDPDLSKLGGTTLAYALLGDSSKTNLGLESLKAKLNSELMERALFFLIMVETTLGNYDTALQYIKQGIQKRLPMMLMLPVEPFLKVLHSLADFQELYAPIIKRNAFPTFEKKKYAKSSLKPEEIEQLYQALNELMLQQKPFLNPKLSMRQLAQLLQMHPNQLSQLLNERAGQNFSAFINSYRLQEFKLKAQNDNYSHLTILGLALECGFGSKTVFNTFFKKEMGITPKAYWQEVQS